MNSLSPSASRRGSEHNDVQARMGAEETRQPRAREADRAGARLRAPARRIAICAGVHHLVARRGRRSFAESQARRPTQYPSPTSLLQGAACEHVPATGKPVRFLEHPSFKFEPDVAPPSLQPALDGDRAARLPQGVILDLLDPSVEVEVLDRDERAQRLAEVAHVREVGAVYLSICCEEGKPAAKMSIPWLPPRLKLDRHRADRLHHVVHVAVVGRRKEPQNARRDIERDGAHPQRRAGAAERRSRLSVAYAGSGAWVMLVVVVVVGC